MNSRKALVSLAAACILLLLNFPVMCQSLFFRSTEVEWNNEPVKVKLLHQDKEGYLWLGTSHGLFKYNGLDYQHYPIAGDSSGQHAVTALHEDKNKVLWVGYDDGVVAVLKDRKLRPVKLAGKKLTTGIAAILLDDRQVLWIATSGEGLLYGKEGKFQHLDIRKGLPDNYTYSLAKDASGAVWVGTDRGIGICRLQHGKVKVQVLNSGHGLPDNIVTVLTPASDVNMWVGTQSAGFCKYNPKLKIGRAHV